MAVELTGYSRQINQASMLKQGLEDLRHADREQAREHLADLRRDLQTKTGVVRLLHTTKTDKDMKFKNAGAFKRMFLDGDKLKRSGDVIKDLLRNAGLSEAKVEEFGKYAAARGNKGVQAQKVLQYIDALQADRGASEQEALSKFGVNLRGLGKQLGKGGFGEVNVVQYRGEDYVYKSPRDGVRSFGALTLTDSTGKAFKPSPVELEKSFAELSEDELKPLHKPAAPGYLPTKAIDAPGGEYDQIDDSEPDDGENSVASSSGSFVKKFILKQLKEDGYEPEDAIQEEPKHYPPAKPAAPKKTELVKPVPQLLISEEDPIDLEPPKAAPVEIAEQKLGRSGVANAARVKDLPQVITPTVFVVREGRSDGTEMYHAVGGQSTLKDWAKVQDKGSSYEVVGLLMPKAKGKNPIEYPEIKDAKGSGKNMKVAEDPDAEVEDPPSKVNVSRSDLKPMAQSALTLLKGMAQHGFIHGDIKPENLMWDAKSKQLQLIDNDDLVKVSKKDGSVVPKGLGASTPIYLNPVVMNKAYLGKDLLPHNAQLGLGRDLYATGLVLLETSLRASGRSHEDTKTIMDSVHLEGRLFRLGNRPTEKLIEILKDGSNYFNLERNTVQDFARTCLIKALEFEQDRINRKDFGFDRTQNGREAALIRELQAELDQVR